MNTQYWNLSLTLIISFIIFVVFTLIQSVVVLLLTPENIEMTANAYKNLAYSNLGMISSVSSVFGIITILLFIYFKKTKITEYLNLYIPKLKITTVFIALSFLMMFLMEYLSDYYPDMFDTDFVLESYKQATSLTALYLGVVILGPVFEELLFRGFLFKGLENSFLGGHGAVFISAAMFSLVHIQYGFPIILCMLFPMAVLFGYARLKSNSLLLPILLHCINNLLTCLVTHFEVY